MTAGALNARSWTMRLNNYLWPVAAYPSLSHGSFGHCARGIGWFYNKWRNQHKMSIVPVHLLIHDIIFSLMICATLKKLVLTYNKKYHRPLNHDKTIQTWQHWWRYKRYGEDRNIMGLYVTRTQAVLTEEMYLPSPDWPRYILVITIYDWIHNRQKCMECTWEKFLEYTDLSWLIAHQYLQFGMMQHARALTLNGCFMEESLVSTIIAQFIFRVNYISCQK